MTEDVIEAPLADLRVDRRIVDRLSARGLVSAAARDFALDAIEPARRWGVWVSRLLTVVGTSLALAGIVYFFAFNWDRIPPLTKLAALAALIAAAVVTVAIVGFGRLVSDAAASAAVMLVGVFLAVFGQIYQTGADAWQLFAGWAALTVVFALLAGSAAAWAVWLAVANVAIVLWWDQTQPWDVTHHAGRSLSLIGFDGAFLAMREILVGRGIAWPAPRWTRVYLALPVLIAVTLLGLNLLDRHRDFGTLARVAAGVVPAVFVAAWLAYRRLWPDVAVLAATAIGAAVLLDFALFDLLTGGGRNSDIGTFFLMGFATLGIFGGAVAWLRAVAREMGA